MDQDLSLMKQLLTLNEAIEDLKWQRNYYHSQSSIPQSSCDLSESDWSVSETDMFGSENEAVEKLTPSSLLIPTSITKADVINDIDTTERDYIVSTVSETHVSDRESVKVSKFEVPVDTRSFLEYPAKLDLFLNGNSRLCHEEQNTFDSGIREPIVRKEIAV